MIEINSITKSVNYGIIIINNAKSLEIRVSGLK